MLRAPRLTQSLPAKACHCGRPMRIRRCGGRAERQATHSGKPQQQCQLVRGKRLTGGTQERRGEVGGERLGGKK